jgi:integrase/recombinase XerD
MDEHQALMIQNGSEPALTEQQKYEEVIHLVTDGMTSEHSRRAYAKALRDFLAWHDALGRPALSKALVQRYRLKLQDDGLSPSTINQRMSAIRKLAAEAADNGLLDQTLANGIKAVQGVRTEGRRAGNWLIKAQAQALLNAPDTSSLKGKRDQALLAVLLGVVCAARKRHTLPLDISSSGKGVGRLWIWWASVISTGLCRWRRG